MTSDKNTRKVIYLAGIAVIIAVLALVFAYFQIFGDDKTTVPVNDKFATFPNSDNQIIPEYNLEEVNEQNVQPYLPKSTPAEQQINNFPESDWRDEIIQVSTNDSVSGYQTRQNVVSDTSTQDSLVDLYAAVDEFNENAKKYSLENSSGVPLFNSDSNNFFQNNDRTDNVSISSINTTLLGNCGKINVPSSDSALEKFISNLDDNQSIVCMGQTVANNCKGAVAEIATEGLPSQMLYVAKKKSGICGVGISYSSDYVRLCDLNATLNVITNRNFDSNYWQKEFVSNPGQTFSLLYNDSSAGLVGAISNKTLDCNLYKI